MNDPQTNTGINMTRSIRFDQVTSKGMHAVETDADGNNYGFIELSTVY